MKLSLLSSEVVVLNDAQSISGIGKFHSQGFCVVFCLL